jgi:hypothetical protein
MKVETGKVYKIFGNKQMLVVKVDRTNIHTVWPNGMVPARQSDRLYPIGWAKHFYPVAV